MTSTRVIKYSRDFGPVSGCITTSPLSTLKGRALPDTTKWPVLTCTLVVHGLYGIVGSPIDLNKVVMCPEWREVEQDVAWGPTSLRFRATPPVLSLWPYQNISQKSIGEKEAGRESSRSCSSCRRKHTHFSLKNGGNHRGMEHGGVFRVAAALPDPGPADSGVHQSTFVDCDNHQKGGSCSRSHHLAEGSDCTLRSHRV
jgi:hypothetical protein